MDYQEGYEKTSLLWLVPLSSRVEKFQPIYNKQIEKYLDHIHTRNNNPVPVKYSIQTEIGTKMKRILQLHARGKKIVFPNISKLQHLMLEEATSTDCAV